jgi:heptaprenyl diphosphate synthase
MKTRDITRMALLTAIALTIFMVEAQLPGLVPVPGIKLGLANIITVYAVFALGPGKAALILTARIFLGAVFSGQMSTILYSGAGGALAIGMTILSRRILQEKQIWIAGVLGAIAHSVGQMAVAVGVTLTPGLLAYLPIMILIGIFTGAFTGLCAQFLTERLKLR